MAISDQEIRNVARTLSNGSTAAVGEVIEGLLDRINDLEGRLDDLEIRFSDH